MPIPPDTIPNSLQSKAAARFRLVRRRGFLISLANLARTEADVLLEGTESERRNQWPPKVPTPEEIAEAHEHLTLLRVALDEAEDLPRGASAFDRPDPYAYLHAARQERAELADEVEEALLAGAILIAPRHSAGPIAGSLFAMIADPYGVIVDAVYEAGEVAPGVDCPRCGAKARSGCMEAPKGRKKGKAPIPCAWHSERVEAGRVALRVDMGKRIAWIEQMGPYGLVIAGKRVTHAGKGFISIDGGSAMNLRDAAGQLAEDRLRASAARRIAEVFVGERGAGIDGARLALGRWRDRQDQIRGMEAA